MVVVVVVVAGILLSDRYRYVCCCLMSLLAENDVCEFCSSGAADAAFILNISPGCNTS